MEKQLKLAPPLQLFVLTTKELECYEGPRFEKRTDGGFTFANPTLFSQSEDGSVLFVASEDDKKVASFDTSTGKAFHAWDVEQPIVKAYVSPLGSYVLTWHYPPRSRAGEPEPSPESWDNMVVWDAKTGAVVWRTQVKNQPETEMWPSIQWTADERFACRMTTSKVHFFNGKDVGGKEEFHLIMKGLSQFNVICGVNKNKEGKSTKHYRVATFVPAKKNTMSAVTVHKVFPCADGETQRMPEKEVTKVFGRGQRVDFLWNSAASALVIKAFSAVDSSGGSYYGTYDCYYVRVDGSIDINLRPKREGTIHDIKWDVHGRRFVMVYGSQPASATVYNSRANPVAEFGVGSRNFSSFGDGGHLLCLGGFGSLKGAIEIWDVKSVKKVGIAESFAASTCQWAPDARHFCTAVLMDRMKVDNVVKIFSYDGTLLKEINKGSPLLLKAVAWRKSIRGIYDYKPPSPRCYEKAAKAEQALAATPARQKYVPPGMRNRGGGSSAAAAALNDLRDTGSSTVGRVNSSSSSSSSLNKVPEKPQRYLIPGEVPSDEDDEPKSALGKKAEKARRKREAKNARKRAEAEEAERVRQEEARLEREREAKYETEDPAEIEKRIKRLKKKLRQLDALKEKDPASLNPEQIKKIQEEGKIFRLVAELEAKLEEKRK